MYCETCDTNWEYASIRCPDCRSRLVDPTTWVQKLCETAPAVDTTIYVGENIPARKASNVREHYPIGNDKLLLLVDATVFGSAKVGLAIGGRGIYWNTDWTTSTRRNALNWEAFAQCTLELHDTSVGLGNGDFIDLAAVGNHDEREMIFEFLKRLRKAARKQQRKRD